MAVRSKMDENLARKVSKKQTANPMNPFANMEANQEDEEVTTPNSCVYNFPYAFTFLYNFWITHKNKFTVLFNFCYN